MQNREKKEGKNYIFALAKKMKHENQMLLVKAVSGMAKVNFLPQRENGSKRLHPRRMELILRN